jgi:hypothetical protein
MNNPAPIAFLHCCGAIVKLTRTGHNTYHGEETHAAHCKENHT